jgi:hypothetical protein
VFTKQRGGEPSKGVDVTLTTALVSHAYRDDYDVAFLICGDGDYVPVVEEIKHAGKRVVVVFFGEKFGLNLETPTPDMRCAHCRATTDVPLAGDESAHACCRGMSFARLSAA